MAVAGTAAYRSAIPGPATIKYMALCQAINEGGPNQLCCCNIVQYYTQDCATMKQVHTLDLFNA